MPDGTLRYNELRKVDVADMPFRSGDGVQLIEVDLFSLAAIPKGKKMTGFLREPVAMQKEVRVDTTKGVPGDMHTSRIFRVLQNPGTGKFYLITENSSCYLMQHLIVEEHPEEHPAFPRGPHRDQIRRTMQ